MLAFLFIDSSGAFHDVIQTLYFILSDSYRVGPSDCSMETRHV